MPKMNERQEHHPILLKRKEVAAKRTIEPGLRDTSRFSFARVVVWIVSSSKISFYRESLTGPMFRPNTRSEQIRRHFLLPQASSAILFSTLLISAWLTRLAAGFTGINDLGSTTFRRQTMRSLNAASMNSDIPFQHDKLKAILFDIDGTLADSWRLGYDATCVVLERNGHRRVTTEEYHQCTRYATPERLARHIGLEPDHSDFEAVGQQLTKEFDDLYVGLVSTETAGYYAGVKELLQDLPPSLVVGALTNACVAYAEAVLETNGSSSQFQSVRGADNVEKPKPAPDGLLQVCEDLSVDPSDCVYIGDSPSDAMAAQAAGMPSIGVLWGSHSEESLQQAPFSTLCGTVDDLRSTLSLVLVK